MAQISYSNLKAICSNRCLCKQYQNTIIQYIIEYQKRYQVSSKYTQKFTYIHTNMVVLEWRFKLQTNRWILDKLIAREKINVTYKCKNCLMKKGWRLVHYSLIQDRKGHVTSQNLIFTSLSWVKRAFYVFRNYTRTPLRPHKWALSKVGTFRLSSTIPFYEILRPKFYVKRNFRINWREVIDVVIRDY